MRGITVVSNRLPVRMSPRADGRLDLTSSDGGLVSALRPVLEERGGAWAGWTGSSAELTATGHAALRSFGDRAGYELLPVPLSDDEHERYYEGACNRVLWPLLHGLVERAEPSPRDASIYFSVNRRFAEVVARRRPDVVWVHDYHLLSMGSELRARLPRARLGFFLHVPFPTPELMVQLPWTRALLPSLAAFDRIGFQTEWDRKNFLSWASLLSGRHALSLADLESRTGAHRISVDWQRYHGEAGRPEVLARAEAIRAELGGRRILLGVDRLDYTKGIPQRLRAYAHLLDARPDLRAQVVFVQLAVPSRTGILEYDRTRREIEGVVAAINAKHGTPDWTPVRYVYGSWTHDELLAWYVAADVGVVTPLRDGMNLVAKEFMAANRGRGALVLSRYAGAAEEVGGGALLVNPFDTGEVAEALGVALDLPSGARVARLRTVQDHLRRYDVHRWARSFVDALTDPARRSPGGWVGAA